MQRALHVFAGATNSGGVAFTAIAHGLLRFLQRFFRGLDIGFGQLVAIFANGLFGLIHNAIQTIARLDLFHSATIVFGV